jgi:hypothetical protein
MAETNCAKWRLESVPVGLTEKGFEARAGFAIPASYAARAGIKAIDAPGFKVDQTLEAGQV